jgi:L-serine dehydratase
MSEKSGVFDMIGPVMIGPSSSHTAGVVRLARTALRILGEELKQAEITFYNSFARTYEGHGSDKAVIAGLLDFKTDDERIRDSLSIAKKRGLVYTFRSIGNASTMHPNSVRMKLSGPNREVIVTGESRGGGVIKVVEIDGFNAGFSASLHTIIIKAMDMKGSIAHISGILANDHCNIATMSVSRKARNDMACLVIEMDSGLKPVTLDYISSLDWVNEVVYIPDIDL